MLEFIRRRFSRKEMIEADDKLQKAFSSVDMDIRKIQTWVSHLHHKHSELESSHKREFTIKQKDIDKLSMWIGYLYKHSTELHSKVMMVQQESAFLNKRLTEVEEKLKALESRSSSVRTEPELGSELNRTEPVRSRFEENMLNQVRPNRKNYVIQALLSAVKESELTTKQLESLIVREKGLCGRTTFYAHMKELKDRGAIDSAMIGSKNVLVVRA